MMLHHFLEASSHRYPDKVALIADGRRLTYAEVEQEANRLAWALREAGVRRGDRVAIWLPNGIEAAIAIFAVLKADGIFVPLNPTLKAEKLRHILADSGAVALFTLRRHAALFPDVLERLPTLRLIIAVGQSGKRPDGLPQGAFAWSTLAEGQPASPPPSMTIGVDLAALIYTSGSTGVPKGVMSTHDNMTFAARSIITYLENRPDDIVINVLPLSFDYGLYQWLMVTGFGGTLVLERSFAYPAAVLRRIEEERVTGLPGVPTLFALLLRLDLSAFDLASLRYLTNTAAALPVEHIHRLRAAFPQARLYSMYGLTECKRALYLPPKELDRRPASVGVPIPGTEAWIEGENGKRLPPGEIGELVIRGPHVMQGYWHRPEATAARYRTGAYPADRRLYSGDLFRQDEAGYFYFVARKDEIIKSRGEKVAPKEVEAVLYRLEGVVEAAVLGVPDPILGQAIKAFVVVEKGSGLDERAILRHCRLHLEDFMVPRYVELRAALPRNASGKIDRRALSQEVESTAVF